MLVGQCFLERQAVGRPGDRVGAGDFALALQEAPLNHVSTLGEGEAEQERGEPQNRDERRCATRDDEDCEDRDRERGLDHIGRRSHAERVARRLDPANRDHKRARELCENECGTEGEPDPGRIAADANTGEQLCEPCRKSLGR